MTLTFVLLSTYKINELAWHHSVVLFDFMVFYGMLWRFYSLLFSSDVTNHFWMEHFIKTLKWGPRHYENDTLHNSQSTWYSILLSIILPSVILLNVILPNVHTHKFLNGGISHNTIVGENKFLQMTFNSKWSWYSILLSIILLSVILTNVHTHDKLLNGKF